MRKAYCPPPLIKVWGQIACFTQPGLKTERVSYPVMTPSAARGLLDAIACRPGQMYWAIQYIDVLNPIQYMGLTRNEFQTYPAADPASIEAFDYEAARTLRHTLYLRDVAYVIRAEAVILPHEQREPGNPNTPSKYHRMLTARAARGGSFKLPYMGTKECLANFSLATEKDSRDRLDLNRDLGHMLFDFRRAPDQPPAAVFFPAQIVGGRLAVPTGLYARTLGPQAAGVPA